jgi:putative oxidoreductase
MARPSHWLQLDERGGESALVRWASIPLRLIVGYGFMVHGFLKLGRGVDVFAAALAGLHVPMPHLMAWITIVIELAGGLAVLLGAYVALASIPMAIVLLVALVEVHLPFGFSSIKFGSVRDRRLAAPPRYLSRREWGHCAPTESLAADRAGPEL